MGILLNSKWILALMVTAAVALSAYTRLAEGPATRYITTHLERGDVRDEVQSTGIINPVVTVQVGSQVSGTVARLNADFNSRVHRGEVIALIDPALFEGALQQATSDLDNAKAAVTAANASLDRARATLAQSEADYKRQATLARIGAVSQSAEEISRANLDAAQSGITAGEAAVEQARALVKVKEAAVKVARTNLEYCTIRSPVDGVVISRNVDVGQTVAASLQAPTIFSIAQDLTKMQLYAKTDESDEGRIKVGETVRFKVGAFPDQTFVGVISQKRMNATTVQNVVTYDTVIAFQNPDLKLFPGMTAYVSIPVATANNVLKISNNALRFRPSLEAQKLQTVYRAHGVGDSLSESQSGTNSAEQIASYSPQGRAVIWKLRSDGTLEPVQIETGITDHAFSEVLRVLTGELSPKDNIVTAIADGTS
jgi:HlyD family secretion protein